MTPATFWANNNISTAQVLQKLNHIKFAIHINHLHGYSGYNIFTVLIIPFRSSKVNCFFVCFAS